MHSFTRRLSWPATVRRVGRTVSESGMTFVVGGVYRACPPDSRGAAGLEMAPRRGRPGGARVPDCDTAWSAMGACNMRRNTSCSLSPFPGVGEGWGEGKDAGPVRTRPHPRPLAQTERGGTVDQPRYVSCTRATAPGVRCPPPCPGCITCAAGRQGGGMVSGRPRPMAMRLWVPWRVSWPPTWPSGCPGSKTAR